MEIEVTILKFENLSKRKDIKRPTWFAAENDILSHPDFFKIDAEEFRCWYWIMSVATRLNSETVRLSSELFAFQCRSSEAVFYSTLDKLKDKRLSFQQLPAHVTDTSRVRHAHVTLQTDKDVRTEQYKTEQDRTEQTEQTNTTSTNSAQIDLSNIADAIRSNPVKKAKSKLSSVETALNKRIWESYVEAYQERYKVTPVVNQTTRSQVSSLRKRLGEEAIDVVAFFVKSNNGYYIQKLHTIGACLADAESLRTQWIRGKAITRNDVRDFEKMDKHAQLIKSIREDGI